MFSYMAGKLVDHDSHFSSKQFSLSCLLMLDAITAHSHCEMIVAFDSGSVHLLQDSEEG